MTTVRRARPSCPLPRPMTPCTRADQNVRRRQSSCVAESKARAVSRACCGLITQRLRRGLPPSPYRSSTSRRGAFSGVTLQRCVHYAPRTTPNQPPINPQPTPDPPRTHPRPIPNQRPIIHIPDIVQSFKGVRDALDGGSKQQGEPHQCVAGRKAHVRPPTPPPPPKWR